MEFFGENRDRQLHDLPGILPDLLSDHREIPPDRADHQHFSVCLVADQLFCGAVPGDAVCADGYSERENRAECFGRLHLFSELEYYSGDDRISDGLSV